MSVLEQVKDPKQSTTTIQTSQVHTCEWESCQTPQCYVSFALYPIAFRCLVIPLIHLPQAAVAVFVQADQISGSESRGEHLQ